MNDKILNVTMKDQPVVEAGIDQGQDVRDGQRGRLAVEFQEDAALGGVYLEVGMRRDLLRDCRPLSSSRISATSSSVIQSCASHIPAQNPRRRKRNAMA